MVSRFWMLARSSRLPDIHHSIQSPWDRTLHPDCLTAGACRFGSSIFKKNAGKMDKTKYLTRRDCAAAEDAGVDHITKDCLFVCEGCGEDNWVRIGSDAGPLPNADLTRLLPWVLHSHTLRRCNTLDEGKCVECAAIGCPPNFFRSVQVVWTLSDTRITLVLPPSSGPSSFLIRYLPTGSSAVVWSQGGVHRASRAQQGSTERTAQG